MAKINKTDVYPIKENINFQDYLIGTDGESKNKETVSFKLFTLLDYLSKNLTALNLIFETLEDAKYYLITNQLDFGTLIFVKESNSFMYVDSSEIDFKYLLEDAGKVNSVNGVLPDVSKNVTLKISNLEDDKGLALLTDLNNEINNRINDYNELQLSIGTETSNRITQINNIEQKLQTEKSERISEDDILNYKIDTTKTELNTNFDAKLSQESTLRQNQDAVLDNKITTEKTDRINANNLKLDKPTTTGSTISHPNVVGVDSQGNSAKLPAGDLGKNFANTDLVVSVNRKHTGTASVEFAMPFICSNSSVRYSGITNKSADATYNLFPVFDSNKNLAFADNPYELLKKGFSFFTAEQSLELGHLLNGGAGSSGAMSVNTISPPIIQSRYDSVEYVVLRGANLFLNSAAMKIEILASDKKTVIVEIPNNQIINNSSLELIFYFNFYQFTDGIYYVRLTSGVKVYTTSLDLQVVQQVDDINLNAITWEVNTSEGVSTSNDVYNGASFIVNSYAPATDNINKSAKTAELFGIGENFYIEINMTLNPHASGGHDSVFSWIGLGYSSTNNALSNNTLVAMNYSWWGSGDGYRIENNTQNNSLSHNGSQSVVMTIKKTGNLFVTTLKTSRDTFINSKTISNNSGYSLFLQMVGRPAQSIIQGQIIKAFKFN